ncbi:aspartyl-phosphate phosphatase Spo0E family protein [Paenibacillus sp. OV219]|uniref:aspartyl-phosphate phosphatase Spo0E family protein n=1 Tax=Paenibacillus sp. OV219 TaxID=1884377 RepID=UPI0008B045E3|nr:aspartyl-phosphate phosphatase Spo0E family protein [Paenibacillus sp. OV219]SEN77584.1 Spo0E like sporulation regulatory protein [Paenibacillus sp. OV219]
MACAKTGRKLMSSSIRLLEDEIYALRIKMEQSYIEEATFSSEKVIDLSRLLDMKINEYMQFRRSYAALHS